MPKRPAFHLALAARRQRAAAGAAVPARVRRPIASRPRDDARPRASPAASPAGPAPGQTHEAHAVQRHPGGGTPGGDRRRPEAGRPRHRVREQGTTQEQHLQGRHHARRAQPRGLLRRLRHRAPRLPAVQGDLAPVPEGRARRQRRGRRRRGRPRPHPGPAPRRHGADRPGRQGRARQQGRGAHDLHLAGRPLPRADAEQPARRRRLAPRRGRGAQRAARRDRRARRPDRA